MELGIQGLRVLVTAGASRHRARNRARVRARGRQGARLRRRPRGARRDGGERSADHPHGRRRGRPRRAWRAVRGGAQGARRARRPDQQRRHRGPDRPRRGDSRRRNGTAASRSTSPASSTACGSRCRTCARAGTPRSSTCRRSPAGSASRCARPMRRRNGAWSASPSRWRVELGPDGIRVNAIQPGVVEGDRIRRVFESKAQARGMSAREVQDEALSLRLAQDHDPAAAARRHHAVPVLAARPHDLRPGDLGLRRSADAGVALRSPWSRVRSGVRRPYPVLRKPAAMPLMVRWMPCTTRSSASPARWRLSSSICRWLSGSR